MFDTVPITVSDTEIKALRRQYRLGDQLTNREVVETVWDQLLRDPSFHRKNLSKNRTDSDK